MISLLESGARAAIRRKKFLDSFAGGGGASLGIKRATGRSPDIAINHDPPCVALHSVNHPETRHYLENVWKVDPDEACQGDELGDAWFSPDCTDFSKAKTKQPRRKNIRGLAWVVLNWGVKKLPDRIYLENVEEFLGWGPLLPDGTRCPVEKGRTFKAFIACLTTGIHPNHPDMAEIRQFLGEKFPYDRLFEGLGYKVEWRELRACDYGAPTIRRRLYLIARRDGEPIVWPSPTHGDPSAPEFAESGLKPWNVAAQCIEWDRPCPSIFLTRRQAKKLRKQFGISIVRPLAKATMKRLARGVVKFVLQAQEPYLINLTHWGSDRNESLREPFRVITGAHRGEKALIAPYLTEHANASTQRVFDANTPMRTQCAEVKGGHFALVAAFLAKHFGGVVGTRLPKPISTITAVDHHSLVASHLTKFYGTNIGQRTDEPMHSITADGNHIGEVRAFLQKYYGAGIGQDLREPIHTIPTLDRFGLVTVNGEDYQISDIGMRMLTPRELFRGQGFPDSYMIDAQYEAVDKKGRKKLKWLTGTQKTRMCGNSVCPDVAEAIVRANYPNPAPFAHAEAVLR